MPQIGWFEILLIISLSIIIVGPKDFPIMLKKIGSWIGSIKKYFITIQDEISNYDEDFNPDEKQNEKNKNKIILKDSLN